MTQDLLHALVISPTCSAMELRLMCSLLATLSLLPALASSSQLLDAPGFPAPLFNFPPLDVGGGRAGPGINFVSLFADYITPRGEGVSEACQEASQLYLDRMNQVTPGHSLHVGPHQFDGAALKMFDASAKLPPAGQLTNFILQHPGTFDSCLEVSLPEWKGGKYPNDGAQASTACSPPSPREPG